MTDAIKDQYHNLQKDLLPLTLFERKKDQVEVEIIGLNSFTNDRYPGLKGFEITDKTTFKEIVEFVHLLGYELNIQYTRPHEEKVKLPYQNKIPVNTKIRIIKNLIADADECHPALTYAKPGETGKIVRHNNFEGYMISIDGSERFSPNNTLCVVGAYEHEFEVI